MKPLAVIISPNWRDYAEKYLVDCLASLRHQTFQDFDLFLIDNESSEKSFAFLTETAPEATIVRLDHNAGFAGGNNAALKRVVAGEYRFAFLVNMDTTLEARCLEELMKAGKEFPQAGAVQARIMLAQAPDRLNSLGNETHFLGFGYCKGYNDLYTPHPGDNGREMAYPSGAAVLLSVAALRRVGLFDEEMWMYNEDQDLGWRMWLAGYACVLAAHAVIYHNYEFSRSIAKYYWMDRNRLIVIFKNYHLLTLLLIAPGLLVMECGLALFSLQSGWWKEKLNVWKYFLSLKHWRYILRERHRIQSARLIKEKKIARLITGRIWYQEIADVKLKLINPVFELYWRLIRVVMCW